MTDDSTREARIREIKTIMDDFMWRSIGLAAGLLKQYDLTVQQTLVLTAAVRNNEPIDMGTLATATMTPPSSMTNVVDRLVGRGLLTRDDHPTDRRRVMVAATEAGIALVSEMDDQDTETWLWLTRRMTDAQMDVLREAFTMFLEEVKELKPEDFVRGVPFPATRQEARTP